MPKLIKMTKTMDRGNDFSSANLETDGEYLFVSQPAASGVKRAADRRKIICPSGILNSEPPSNSYTIAGITNGTARDVTIIIPTIRGSLPPTRLATKGAPRPVDIPDRSRQGNAKGR